eukprot:1397108-Pyramimonas_sp.AAC.1
MCPCKGTFAPECTSFYRGPPVPITARVHSTPRRWADVAHPGRCHPPMIRSEKYNDGVKYAGTSLVSGSCIGIVTATGMATEMGSIQDALSSDVHVDTPLSLALDTFGEDLAKVR